MILSEKSVNFSGSCARHQQSRRDGLGRHGSSPNDVTAAPLESDRTTPTEFLDRLVDQAGLGLVEAEDGLRPHTQPAVDERLAAEHAERKLRLNRPVFGAGAGHLGPLLACEAEGSLA